MAYQDGQMPRYLAPPPPPPGPSPATRRRAFPWAVCGVVAGVVFLTCAVCGGVGWFAWAKPLVGARLPTRGVVPQWSIAEAAYDVVFNPGTGSLVVLSDTGECVEVGGDGSVLGRVGPQDFGAVSLALADLDGDGTAEYITWGVGDVRARASSGAELWRAPFGIGADHASAADLDGDGRDEVIVCDIASVLTALDGTGQRVWMKDALGYGHHSARDTDGAKGDEVLAVDVDGTVHVLDASGSVTNSLTPLAAARVVGHVLGPAPAGSAVSYALGDGPDGKRAMVGLGSDGGILWTLTDTDLGTSIEGTAVPARGAPWVAVVDLSGAVCVVDAARGEVLATLGEGDVLDAAWLERGPGQSPWLITVDTEGTKAYEVSP